MGTRVFPDALLKFNIKINVSKTLFRYVTLLLDTAFHPQWLTTYLLLRHGVAGTPCETPMRFTHSL